MTIDHQTTTEHFVPRADGRVRYLKLGQGAPLVFLHPCPTGSWMFDKVLPDFAERFTCIAIDMPGFGRSDLPPRRYSLDDFTAAIMDVLDHAELSRPHFLGSRTGAVVTIDLAAKHPDRVGRLILEGSPGWNAREGAIIYEKIFKPDYGEDGLPRVRTYEESMQRTPGLTYEQHELLNEALRNRGQWFVWCHEMHTGTDIAGLMPRVTAPTMVIFKEGDPLRRREQRFLDEIKGSVLRVFPGPDGRAYLDSPAEFVEEVTRFLSSEG